MRARQAGGPPQLPWWTPGLASTTLGAGAAGYGFTLGGNWRAILSVSPLDPSPASGLLVIALAGGFACVLGLILTVSRSGNLGLFLFAPGVGIVCGVILGFVTGPS